MDLPRAPLALPVTLPKNSPTVGELSPGRVVPRPAISGSAPEASRTTAPAMLLTTALLMVVAPRSVRSGLPPHCPVSVESVSFLLLSNPPQRTAYSIFTCRLMGSDLAVRLRRGSAVGRPLR